jgi:ferredoxin-nitrite reductase
VGPGGHLKEKPEIEKVPCSTMLPVLEDLCVEKFGAVRKVGRCSLTLSNPS